MVVLGCQKLLLFAPVSVLPYVNDELNSVYLVKEMLFANCSHFANVVDKANGSLCGSVAFADTNVPEAVQELGPCIRSDPVSHGESHLVIPVTVTLEEEGRAPAMKAAKALTLMSALTV